MTTQRNWGNAARHLLAVLVLTAVASAAFYGAYWLDEPAIWSDEETGLEFKVLSHAECWRPVKDRHPLDLAAGRRLVSVEPLGGLAHFTVHKLSDGEAVDPEEFLASLDTERKRDCDRYGVFWRAAPSEGSWRMEHSFRGLNGLKTVKRLSGAPDVFGGEQLVFDYVIQGPEGCWWYIGAYVPQLFLRYYELDLKYTLASVKLGE